MNEESIFAQALELKTPAERAAFLDRACAEHPALRAQVEELLAADAQAGSFLDHPPAGMEATVAVTRAGGDTKDGREWCRSLDFLERCDAPGRIGKLGHYEIDGVIGNGGMGAVLKAFDTKLSRVVAVKVLAPELAVNPTAVKRFLREAQSGAAVHHEHVVTIHAVDEAHRPPYLVMEFIEGQTLAQKLEREGALPLVQVVRIGAQIAAGLAAAHKHGLIHRDVKPGNILLENGVQRVKITDFGLARAADDLEMTQTGMIAGTPQFMSPEQAKGEPIDTRSDLFSLGSVLYSMCTGRPAFRAETTMAVLRRVCDDQPRPIHEVNAEIPRWLEAIVTKLLAKDPSDRFQTADEVAELLQRHLAHLQNPAQVPAPATVVALPHSNRRGARSGVSPLALIAVVGLVLSLPLLLAFAVGASWFLSKSDTPSLEVAWSPSAPGGDAGRSMPPADRDLTTMPAPSGAPALQPEGLRGMAFDGRDDLIMLPSLPWHEFSAFTVEAWVLGWQGPLMCQGMAVEPENSVWLSIGEATASEKGSVLPTRSFGWEYGSGRNIHAAAGRLPLRKWTHVAMVFDGQRQYFFVDGDLRVSQPAKAPGRGEPTRKLFLGGHQFAPTFAYGKGVLGPTRISSAARYTANFVPPAEFADDDLTELLLPMQLDPGQDVVLDESGHQRHGLVAGPQAFEVRIDDEWEEPENLGSVVNSEALDAYPTMSADGLVLIFASSRTGGLGGQDLWMSTRASRESPWSPPVNLGPEFNSSRDDSEPCLSPDGLTLTFCSARSGGVGSYDIWQSRRPDRAARWPTPQNLGAPVNTPKADGGPWISADGRMLAFHRFGAKGSATMDLWYSTRESPEDAWSEPQRLAPEIDDPQVRDWQPRLSADGLSLWFSSNRPGSRGTDSLWVSRRRKPGGIWSQPALLSINSTSWDLGVHISSDGELLLFHSYRDGGSGSADIWMARRKPGRSAPIVVTPGEDSASSTLARLLPAGSSAEKLTSARFTWSEPAPVEPLRNTQSHDWSPEISADGLTLLVASDREGTLGGMDLWMCQRKSLGEAWGEPVNLGAPINSDALESSGHLSADGLTLVFTSSRSGGQGGLDLWVARRASQDAAWSDVQNLGPMINSTQQEEGPYLTDDGLTLYYCSGREGGFGKMDLWMSRRSSLDEPWGEPVNLGPRINGPADEYHPCVAADGLSLLLQSTRGGQMGVWVATRPDAAAFWSEPVALTSVRAGPSLAHDASELYYNSHDPSGGDLGEVWMVRRIPVGE